MQRLWALCLRGHGGFVFRPLRAFWTESGLAPGLDTPKPRYNSHGMRDFGKRRLMRAWRVGIFAVQKNRLLIEVVSARLTPRRSILGSIRGQKSASLLQRAVGLHGGSKKDVLMAVWVLDSI